VREFIYICQRCKYKMDDTEFNRVNPRLELQVFGLFYALTGNILIFFCLIDYELQIFTRFSILFNHLSTNQLDGVNA